MKDADDIQMSELPGLWSGPFGDAYHERNEYVPRMPFWRRIVETTKCRTALELGCGRGHNLLTLKSLGVSGFGVEVNEGAVKEARAHGLSVFHGDAMMAVWLHPESVDLVMTVGMLIHVPPHELDNMMHAIVRASRRYVLAVEYAAEAEAMVEYRGEKDVLWRRPFGKLYESLGLKVVMAGDAAGWDRCTYWLMEKP